jgi:hypothetical protein
MERLKEDIDVKAEKFGHIEYYDAKLRDGHSNEIAIAASEVRDLDARRKPLASINPLFAKLSDLPPTPNVENITFEHISLNLPVIAKNALDELNPQKAFIDDTIQNSDGTNNESTNLEETHTGEATSQLKETVNDDQEEIPNENEGDFANTDDYIYSSEELEHSFTDEDLIQICKKMGIEYIEPGTLEIKDRQWIIKAILDAQNDVNND